VPYKIDGSVGTFLQNHHRTCGLVRAGPACRRRAYAAHGPLLGRSRPAPMLGRSRRAWPARARALGLSVAAAPGPLAARPTWATAPFTAPLGCAWPVGRARICGPSQAA